MHSPDRADFALDPPALAGLVVRDLAGGKDVLLLIDPLYGAAMLDLAAVRLSGGRDRIVRVSAAVPGGLDFDGLLRQLGRCAGLNAVPEQDIAVLTTLDPTCDRIILLIDHAELLERGALLAIQLACRASIRLRLVFAGLPGLLATLDHPELATLEGRLLRGVRYTTVADQPDMVESASLAVRSWDTRRLLYAGCAVLAFSAVLICWSLARDDGGGVVQGMQTAVGSLSPVPEINAEMTPAPANVPDQSVLAGDALEGKQTKPALSLARHTPIQPAPHGSRHGFPPRETNLSRADERAAGGYRAAAGIRQPQARNVAEGDPYADYIGTFSTGPGGVRLFQYRP